MTELNALTQLLQAYLHLDWPEDYAGEPMAAVEDFATQEPELAARLRSEIELLLREYPSEQQLRDLVLDKLASGYTPDASGMSFREWLGRVVERVDQVLSGA